MRPLVKNLALAAASTATLLAVLEGVARVVLREKGGGKEQRTTALYTEFDPLLGWRKRPDARATFHRREYTTEHAINSRALRGPEREYQAPPGVFRVLTLGDSFVEGQGVDAEQTATALLEFSLGAPGCPVQGLNGGTIGYSTDQEYLFYAEEGSRYSPQVVILFLYYNDVVFNTSASYYGRPKPLVTFASGRLEVKSRPAPFTPLRAEAEGAEDTPPAPRGSVLFGWIRGRLKRGAPGWYDTLAGMGLWPKIRVVPAKREMFVYRRDAPDYVEAAWKQTASILEALRSRAEADGARLLVVYVPSRMEVSDRDWELTRQTYGLSEQRWDRGLVRERLRVIGRSTGIPVLDLTPALRREDRGVLGSPYYVYDGHWNTAGHRTAAHEIGALLKTLGWLPACAALEDRRSGG